MKRGLLSRGARYLREGLKKACARASAKIFKARSYSFFGLPCGITTGLAEGSIQWLFPKETIKICPPKSIEEPLYWKMQRSLPECVLPPSGVLIVKDATATCRGGNLSVDGKLITTFLQLIDGKGPQQQDIMRFSTKNFFPRIYYADEPVVTIATGWQGAFYHWMYEVLPRLKLIEEIARDLKIYAEVGCAFQKESLQLIGVSEEQLINAKKYSAVKTARLIVPSIPEVPTQWACDFLRSKCIPKLKKKRALRIYISRLDAKVRRILNEEELFLLLKKEGFEKITLSHLTFQEQAELFYSAEAIVGPHGAGFSHLVFCKPATPVLEIFSPAYVNLCYWHVSDRVGLSYHYLFGEGKRYPQNMDPHIDPDIVVDTKKILATLKLMNL